MSCPLIVRFITVTAIGFAMAQLQEPTKSLQSSLVGDASCEALNKFSNRSLMEAKEFTKNLAACAKTEPNENRTQEATVLVDIFSKLKREELANLTKYPEIMNRISHCVVEQTGFNFTTEEASQYFGLPDNNIVSFQFKAAECQSSSKLLECVEEVYGGLKLNATTKSHKNSYMKLFDGLNPYCDETGVPDDTNNSYYCIPSLTLVLGSALMVIKYI